MIRLATAQDIEAVAAIYDAIHQAEEKGLMTTGWLRGIYPTRATAEAAVSRGDLYVLTKDEKVRGSAIINQTQVDVYSFGGWAYPAKDEETCVLHTLVIAPEAARKGYAKQLITFYEAFAKARGCVELRLDTNARNTVARIMYRKLGYKEIGIVPTVFNGIPGVQLVLLEKRVSV